MKSAFKTTTILASASLAAIVSIAAAFQAPVTSPITAPIKMNDVASVTVTAKRMSAEEKLAFDLQNQEMQTVVISTKRLSAEQKLAMAQEDQAMQATLARKATRVQTSG